MGDLKSKLRAKFTRRNSGIPSVSSSKSSEHSTHTSESCREPLPSPLPRETSEKGTGPDQNPDRDGEFSAPPSARDSTHTDTAPSSNSNNSAGASGSASADTTTRSSASTAHAKIPPQNATADNVISSSRPGQTNMHPTVHDLSSTGPVASSLASAPEAVTPVPSGPRHRHQLSSIDEQATDSDKSPRQDDNHNPRADDASIEPLKAASSTAPVSSDSLRRIRLSDPPIHDSPTPNPNANANGLLTVRSTSTSSSASRAAGPPRRQSLLPSRQNTLIRTLLSAAQADDQDTAGLEQLLQISPAMVTRKIWVRRQGGSATLVTINEEDLVDDVRELILRKYANSLGRLFDAPDLTLRIVPREQQRQERVLGPEEPMARTMDAYFPGGQTVDEALIIDIPLRRTPKPSPRNGPPHAQHLSYYDEPRPAEASTDYFGPEAIANLPAAVAGAVANGTALPHAISVLNTGQVPQIPSPGGSRSRPYRERPDRPRLGRQHTSSPTVLNVAGGHAATIAVATNHGTQQVVRVPRSRTHSNASSDQSMAGSAPPPAPPLPTPPAPEAAPVPVARAATPPPRVASPRPLARPKKKKTTDHPALPTGMLNGGVPPISVLIVEDNIINLRLLEAFVKRLKVRWQTAMNGREAVTKWRTGGFHLVLMDIQLPVMSGLEATREIRRLERMNQIGAFSTANGDSSEAKNETSEEDILPNRDMFKSPVIIVALTASSLQSDRHEALAAGCNDFLTKPVTYVWLERKVMEWGCMQALIDFDGWRKWKDFASGPKGEDDAAGAAAKKAKAKKNRLSLTNSPSDTR
ncbi:hypothetical protein V8F33_011756 [Rhypophila sp. PSN 637]